MSKYLQIIAYINVPGKGLFGWADVNDSKDQLLEWGYWATKRLFLRETGIWIYPVFRDGKITAVLNNKTKTIGDYKIEEFTGK